MDTNTVIAALPKNFQPASELKHHSSENSQVFEFVVLNERYVVKFATPNAGGIKSLRSDVARMEQARRVGLPSPKVLHTNLCGPGLCFAIYPHLGKRLELHSQESVLEPGWSKQADIVEQVRLAIRSGKLKHLSHSESFQRWKNEVDFLERSLNDLNLWEKRFFEVFREMDNVVRHRDWIPGCTQPPSILFDGSDYWAIDWHPFVYLDPIKWVCDWTFYERLSDREKSDRHAAALLDGMGIQNDQETQNDMKRWLQFKALYDGAYLVRKADKRKFFSQIVSAAFN
ncbi:MAG: hypothetical protein JJU20_03375 [Opitutales bacterium]|nr:hypothetical protein [Opitutales bacterium]